MKRFKPRSKAEANWIALLDLPQIVLERTVEVLRTKKSWRTKLDRWGVVSVGYGYRASGPEQVHRAELALILRVKKKWKRPPKPGSARARNAIPKSLRMTLVIDGIRRTFAVPVDIQEHSVPASAAASSVVVTAGAGSGSMRGVPCALVREAKKDRPLYLLSCQHVFGGSKWHPYRPLVPGLEVKDRRFERSLSQDVTPAIFEQSIAYDAALARLHAAGEVIATDAGFWPTELPKAIVRNDTDIRELARFDIHVARLEEPIECRFVGVETNFTIRAPIGATYRASRVIRAEFTDRNRTTLPGDSGSPVMAATILAGMHIAGDDRYSYFIPAYTLFYPDIAFDIDLDLASDAIG